MALDRVQCCPQIVTGSGRPLQPELPPTERIYLDLRPLGAGLIEAGGRPSPAHSGSGVPLV
ncbi:isopentenyl transferase family protein [Mesorhizobium atlanticum]|uniref:isopentenyl transferase family protein n=1 Tax=Mesorhizobium atlanticum TaxID=2233532 RepID=UPI00315D33F9